MLVIQLAINVGTSLEHLIKHKQVQGFVDGPSIPYDLGKAYYMSRAIDDCLHKILEDFFFRTSQVCSRQTSQMKMS
jgi:hypothetical protein